MPAARVGKMARDAFKNYMSFSPARFEERHGSSFQRRQPLARFLVTSWCAPRSNIKKTGTARREAVRASVGEVVKKNYNNPNPKKYFPHNTNFFYQNY